MKTERGTELSVNLAPVALGYRQAVTGAQFQKTLSTTFQICKDPEKFPEEEMEVTQEEFRILSRWLNRRRFQWFHPIDNDNPYLPMPWFRAYFTLKRIDTGGRTIGIELEMSTDSPFGYGEEVEETFVFSPGNMTKVIEDKNDEPGHITPQADIICQANGDLQLRNKMTGSDFRMKGCVIGEVISQSGDTKIISAKMVGENLVAFPGSASYASGRVTLSDGVLYTVDENGAITAEKVAEVII